tara:strand:+ start:471 stop:596 length:126 start_codon:yes stop_codon:yes gene_type:complete
MLGRFWAGKRGGIEAGCIMCTAGLRNREYIPGGGQKKLMME